MRNTFSRSDISWTSEAAAELPTFVCFLAVTQVTGTSSACSIGDGRVVEGAGQGSIRMAVHRRRRPPPPPDPLPPDQRDHCGKTRNLQSGKSGQASFGTQTFGPPPPLPPLLMLPSGGGGAGTSSHKPLVICHLAGPSGSPRPPVPRAAPRAKVYLTRVWGADPVPPVVMAAPRDLVLAVCQGRWTPEPSPPTVRSSGRC